MAVWELKVLPAQAQPSGLPCPEPNKFQPLSKMCFCLECECRLRLPQAALICTHTLNSLFVRALLLPLPYPVPTHERPYISTLSSNTLQPIDHRIFKADCIF